MSVELVLRALTIPECWNPRLRDEAAAFVSGPLSGLLAAADELYTASAPSEPGHALWETLRDAIEAASCS